MISFAQSRNEIRIYKISSGNKFDGMYDACLAVSA